MGTFLSGFRILLWIIIVSLMWVVFFKATDFSSRSSIWQGGHCISVFVLACACLIAEFVVMISSGVIEVCSKLLVFMCWILSYSLISSSVYHLSSAYVYDVKVEIALAVTMALGTIAALIDIMTGNLSSDDFTKEVSGMFEP